MQGYPSLEIAVSGWGEGSPSSKWCCWLLVGSVRDGSRPARIHTAWSSQTAAI